MMRRRRGVIPDDRYPLMIAGGLTLRTGDRVPLTAWRTDEIDDTGCRVYDLRPDSGDELLPVTQADYLAGGIGLQLDLVPAMSGVRFGFLPDDGGDA